MSAQFCPRMITISLNLSKEKITTTILGQYAQNVGTQKSSAPITSSGSLCDARRILGDNAMEVARIIGINGRSLGNLIRGSSKSAGGWTLVGVYQDNIDVQHLINDKDVTTNLITSM